MANILILNGASRKNGNTAALIKAFSEGALSAGNQVKEFYLQTMDIHGCLGCEGCSRTKKGTEDPCIQKDDMSEINKTFMTAGGSDYSQAVKWYETFERNLGWTNLGEVLGSGKTEEAKRLGSSIK